MTIAQEKFGTKSGFVWRSDLPSNWGFHFPEFSLDEQKDLIDHIIKGIGQRSESAMTIQVPFEELLDSISHSVDTIWNPKASTKRLIEVNLGPQNVEQMQQLVLGKGTSHHGIIIGKTGSGKTNLMDVIITALSLKYSPDEIQFYLIDLKKGVGFKPYADVKLPHARVIAIDSEREFALSVLRGLIVEMDQRGDLFRQDSVDSIAAYRDKSNSILARIILVIDEFQNLFLEDDQMAQEAAQILERLTREGRSFGIHILLGSQSLSGRASKLSSATLGQIGIRIALMCNESDARAIMADDNPEARLLSRPGEAIYNNLNGLIEGNKRFQVAYFADETRLKYLNLIKKKAELLVSPPSPVVFEGNQLARFEECELFKVIFREGNSETRKAAAWLGEPIRLSNEPTKVHFRRQAGNNLLVVAKEEGEATGIMVSAWLSLALQVSPKDADFLFLNFTNVEEPWHEIINEIGKSISHKVEKIERKQLTDVMAYLANDVKDVPEDIGLVKKTRFLLIFGLQRAKDLRVEQGFGYSSRSDEQSAAKAFTEVLRNGPETGLHVLASCDMVANVRRTLDPKAINEFSFRVASQMSQDDSRFMIDNPAASRLDRAHRAVFYDEDRPGYLEKFRPFALSQDKDWWETTLQKICTIHNS